MRDRTEAEEAGKLLRALRADRGPQRTGDERIQQQFDALWREFDEMRLYLAAIAQTIAERGSITQTDLSRIVDMIDRPDREEEESSDVSPEPSVEIVEGLDALIAAADRRRRRALRRSRRRY